MKKTNKYPNGYLPKMAYWLTAHDYSVEVRTEKYQYFYKRQIAMYGPLTQDQYKTLLDLIEVELSKDQNA